MIGRIAAAAVLLVALIGAAEPGPAAYAFRTPIRVVAASPLQQVTVPAAALINARSADLADLRVFDADQRPVPIALLPAPAPATKRREIAVVPQPILGAPGALEITGIGLRIGPDGDTRVVSVDGKPSVGPESAILGVLLDTRSIRGSASELLLDARVPDSQPVTFRVEQSPDLRTWTPVADHVAFRAPGASPREAISLDGAVVERRYLRVTWRAATRLLSPVAIERATIVTSEAVAPPPLVADLTGATLVNPRELRFALGFATPVTAVQVVPEGGEMLLPVIVSGRIDSEQPWSEIGRGTVFRVTRGQVTTGQPIALADTGARLFRIEGDRGPGFAAVPRVRLLFAPRRIAMLLTGRPPYTLAVGRAGAEAAFLPLGDLLAGAGSVSAADLPEAVVAAPAAVAASVDDAGGGASRTRLLWVALLAGTLLLGVIAWLAARTPAAPPS